jgi:hypothetical protein
MPPRVRPLAVDEDDVAELDLVAVGERGGEDAAPVDERAAGAAVVEQAHLLAALHDHGVAARHRHVVEAQVGAQSAADMEDVPVQRDLPARDLQMTARTVVAAAEAGFGAVERGGHGRTPAPMPERLLRSR